MQENNKNLESTPKKKEVGYCKPPNRFSSTNQPKHNPGRPKGISLTTLLKKHLEKKISYEDPETQKIIKGRVQDAIVWRLILNATQGDNQAIKEIFERVDGKLQGAPLIDQSQHTHFTMEIISDNTKKDTSPFSLKSENRLESTTRV